MSGVIFGVSGLIFWVSELIFWVSELIFLVSELIIWVSELILQVPGRASGRPAGSGDSNIWGRINFGNMSPENNEHCMYH